MGFRPDMQHPKDQLSSTLQSSLAHRWVRPELWLVALACLALFVLFSQPASSPVPPPVTIGEPVEANPQKASLGAPDNWVSKLLKEGASGTTATTAGAVATTQDVISHPLTLGPVPKGHVRVAAIQYCPLFGKPELNRKRVASILEYAVTLGVQIAVLPEAAIPGYADPEEEEYWARGALGDTSNEGVTYSPVEPVAEAVNGPTVQMFSPLCKKWGLYLTLPVIEKHGEQLFSAVWLMDPNGEICLRVRKETLWREGDSKWATAGSMEQVPVVNTPLGRIGLMLTYDMHRLLPVFQAQKVDHVLHVSALVGENWGPWLEDKLPHYIRRGGFNLVLANWSHPWPPHWTGYGLSRVLGRSGRHLWRVKNDIGNQIVIADVPQTRDIEQVVSPDVLIETTPDASNNREETNARD